MLIKCKEALPSQLRDQTKTYNQFHVFNSQNPFYFYFHLSFREYLVQPNQFICKKINIISTFEPVPFANIVLIDP